MAGVYGRIGSAVIGSDIRADFADGRITGRMGGSLRGKDLDLGFDGATLSGRWGGGPGLGGLLPGLSGPAAELNKATRRAAAVVGERDAVFVQAKVRIYAYARGSGSYAELNFSDGAANYIQLPYVVYTII